MDEASRITDQLIDLALAEDKVAQDITTQSLLIFDRPCQAEVTSKQKVVLSGSQVFILVFHKIDPQLEISLLKKDGDKVEPGELVFTLEGSESSVLKGERTALNFLQRLSGVATLTRQYVERIAHLPVQLLDTRKTTPGMRYLEKKAVVDGGGRNHRLNLGQMVMIKDNHIRMAGSISRAVAAVRHLHTNKKIEVEVSNLKQLRQALALKVDIIMLDNFSPEMAQKAVKMKTENIKYEVSGNITLDNILSRAIPGIDYVSVGALTHSAPAVDFSLNIRS